MNINKENNHRETTKRLRDCTTRQQVEDIFNDAAIENDQEKIDLIRETMGEAEVFYCGGPTPSQKVEREISMLIDGEWKADELYELPRE